MKHFLNYILSAVCVVSLIGCEQTQSNVSPADLSHMAPKLFVAAFISPQDTILTVKVSESTPLLSTTTLSSGEIPHAAVTLSDGQKTISLLYDSRLRFHRVSARMLPIIAGKDYTLVVKAPDGRRVEATCRVPGAVPLKAVRFDSVTTEAATGKKRYFIQMQWQDVPRETNYYRTMAIFTYTRRNEGTRTFRPDSSYATFGEGGRITLLPDGSADGQTLGSERGYLAASLLDTARSVQFGRVFRSATVRANLFHVDKNYYDYHRYLEVHRATNDNPFTEPVPLPTNIQGGLGCFGAYNRSTVVLRLR